MTVRVALRLRGLDLQDPCSYATIPGELADLAFQAVGPMSYAVCYIERDGAREHVLECARRIHEQMPDVSVERVHVDLVTLGDIAERCSVSHEAVRLWAAGRRRFTRRAFPEPYDGVNVGSGRMTMLYQWPEVVAWVREVVHLDPEDGLEFLDRASVAEIDQGLADGVAFGQAVGQPSLAVQGPAENWRAIDAGDAEVALRLALTVRTLHLSHDTSPRLWIWGSGSTHLLSHQQGAVGASNE